MDGRNAGGAAGGAPQKCIAVLDIGTTAVKACLFSPALRLLACSVREYALTACGERVEAKAGLYLDAARMGMAEALAAAPGWTPAAVSVATQGETLVPVDGAGTPLCPFLVWLDGRAGTEAEALRSRLPEEIFYRTTGLPGISGALPLAKLLWLRKNAPELFSRARKFLLLEDYFLHWMTGRFITEKSLQTSTGWFDLRRGAYWAAALDAAGVPPEKLPEPLECGEAAGPLLLDAAAALGLPAGIPVVTGAMDQTAAALAAGGVSPGTVTETTGTALVMAACTDAPVFARGHRVTIYRHALAGKYLYLPIGNTAGMALRWFRDEFCRDLPAGARGYAALDTLAQAVPCGCEGLVFLPFLSGSVDPDACENARAAFFGARLSTTRAHFVRSVMESVAFLLRDFLEMLDALGCPADAVYSLGGGARSAVWQQIKADVCGRAFHVPVCGEATAMGAALLAGWGCGLIERNTFPRMERSAVYSPNAENALACRKAYALYKRLYAAVRPLYHTPQADAAESAGSNEARQELKTPENTVQRPAPAAREPANKTEQESVCL